MHNLAIKHFAVGVFVAFDAVAAPGAPLFEEEGCTMSLSLLLDVERPFFFHRTGLGTTLATDNYPVDVLQVKLTEIFEKRFTREEANGSRCYAA